MPHPIRWAGRERDRYLGPFTYTPPEPRHPYRNTGVVLGSGRGGDDDDEQGARVRVDVHGHTLHVALPGFFCRPYRWRQHARFWSDADRLRMGRDWYWRSDAREYGVSYAHEDGALHVKHGRQTDDSDTDHSFVKWAPWRRWRIHREILLDTECRPFRIVRRPNGRVPGDPDGSFALTMEEDRAAKAACPALYFMIRDVDGETITARVRMEQTERRLGEGCWRWLSWLRRPWTARHIDVEYGSEQGSGKGSWKGGTCGVRFPCGHTDDHAQGFARLCRAQGISIVGMAEPWPNGVRPTRAQP